MSLVSLTEIHINNSQLSLKGFTVDLLQSITSPDDGSLPPSLAAAVDMIGGVPLDALGAVVVTVLATSDGQAFAVAGKLPPVFVALLSSLYDIDISSRIVAVSPFRKRF